MRIYYNAPFVLTFALLATGAMFLDNFTAGRSTAYVFTLHPQFQVDEPLTYARFFTHSLGHASWPHLTSNMTFILLIGPMLEEKYGSKSLLVMSILTALATGIMYTILFPAAPSLLGASGIVFMMILLASFTRSSTRKGIPLTFLLVLGLFLGKEILNAFKTNNISEFAHVVGGILGSIFGFTQQRIENG